MFEWVVFCVLRTSLFTLFSLSVCVRVFVCVAGLWQRLRT